MIGSPLLYATSAFGSLGDALFGYDQGIMAGITVACLQLSAAVGSIMAGWLGDVMGRKRCVRVGAFIYFGTAFIQAFAEDLGTFIVGRTLQGLGVGFLSMTVPIIQTEIAKPHKRGMMVGIEYTFLIGGYAASCWIDYAFNFMLPSNVSWQGPYFVQMGLAFVLFAMSFFLPETPRWLARNGFTEGALKTVADLHSNGDIDNEETRYVFMEIMQAVKYEASIGGEISFYKSLQPLAHIPTQEMFTKYRKRTLVGITAQMFAQLNGINVISFYLPSTLEQAGFSVRKSLLYTAANSVPYVASTIPVWWLADRWGRRPLLITGGVAMAVALTIMCVFTEASMGTLTRANGIYSFVMIYNVIYGCTWGPMPWLLPAEIFPLRARSKGMALATLSNWLFNFAIGMSSPKAFDGMGGYYYILIACFCLFSTGLAKFYYVETANHTLEEIAIAFGDKAFVEEDDQVIAQAKLSRRSNAGKAEGDV
ncbi:unnamed protein product [Diplocarpon coronariae]